MTSRKNLKALPEERSSKAAEKEMIQKGDCPFSIGIYRGAIGPLDGD